MTFTSTLNLDDLNGINGLTLNGSSGPVSNIGDINGDGFDDVIIGAPSFRYRGFSYYDYSPSYAQRRRESYVVFGGQNVAGGSLNLPTLDEPNGFLLDFDFTAASAAGNINGDGLDDVIIGVSEADPNGIDNAGESYVVFGSSNISQNNFDLTALDGSNGFAISGIEENNFSGSDVSAAGDVNNDGLDDIIISAPSSNFNDANPGESYVVFGASTFSSDHLELAALDGQNGFVINGIDPDGIRGSSVSGAGDINGDGIDDLIVSGNTRVDGSEIGPAEAYVVFGGQDVSSGSFDLSTLDGSNGFVVSAIPDVDFYSILTATVSSAGDINGDGIDDIAIGTPNIPQRFRYSLVGKSYVVFGSRDAFSSDLNLADLDGSNGLIISNSDADNIREFGQAIDGISDINGDGFDDLLIGTSPLIYSGNYFRGDIADRGYVIFGGPDFSDGPLDAAELDGSDGFTIPAGASVSSAGDFNGDGLNDFIVGDGRGNENGGVSYIVFGRAPDVPVFRTDAAALTTPENTRFITDLEVTDNLDGEGNGLTYSLTGGTDQAFFSLDAVSGALSLDLIPDFENPTDADQDNTYEVEVTVTDSDGFSQTGVFAIDVTDVSFGTITPAHLNGSNGFMIEGVNENDRSGRLVSSAGDVNGDGFDDVIVGSSGTGYGSSLKVDELYVVFGGRDFSSDRLNLADLNGNNGFVVEGSSLAASNAGDINNDGIDDLIIGTSEADANGLLQAGQTFVLFGRQDFSSSPDLTALDGTNGFVINATDAGDGAGLAVSPAGDINTDGIDDLIIGAPSASPSSTGFGSDGESYVVFGGQDFSDGTLNLASLDGSNGFIIVGDPDLRSALGTPVSDIGDVNGDGVDDLAISGSSSDIDYIVFGGQDFSSGRLNVAAIDGSNGFVVSVGIRSFRYSVDQAGDINGDGFDDIVVVVDTTSYSVGTTSYIVFGQSDFSEDPFLNVRAIPNGRDGFQTDFPTIGLGDINDDGFDDLIIGSPFPGNSSFVRFGESELDIDELNNPRGFSINGVDEDDRFSFAVSNAGDVNGDGVNDIIIGAPFADPNGVDAAGETYVIFSGDILSSPSLTVDATLSVVENNTTVVDINATDDSDTEDNGLIYRITDGADRDRFAIAPFTGELSFITAPDFENPGDVDRDNTYEVEVSVTNSIDLSDTQLLSITVQDEEEGGTAPTLDVGLFNADTDTLIATLADHTEINASDIAGRNITLAAFVPEDSPLAGDIGSIFLNLNDGQITRRENAEPYALFGDIKGDLNSGDFELAAGKNVFSLEVFSERGLQGNLLETVTRSFTVIDDLVSDVTVGLFDADTDTLIQTIADGDQITVDPNQNLTLAAFIPEASPFFGQVESVFLNLNEGQVTRTENAEPYALFGDIQGDFRVGSGIPLGDNTLSLDLFAANGRSGEQLGTANRSFTLINSVA
ncbi:MAG: beta strand repeat-containing protein [Leptolyngbyaceae cyanobacterium]